MRIFASAVILTVVNTHQSLARHVRRRPFTARRRLLKPTTVGSRGGRFSTHKTSHRYRIRATKSMTEEEQKQRFSPGASRRDDVVFGLRLRFKSPRQLDGCRNRSDRKETSANEELRRLERNRAENQLPEVFRRERPVRGRRGERGERSHTHIFVSNFLPSPRSFCTLTQSFVSLFSREYSLSFDNRNASNASLKSYTKT